MSIYDRPNLSTFSMKFTDSHCHLDFPELAGSLNELLATCEARDIHRLIVPSVSPSNWQSVLNASDLSKNKFNIFPALGIHPWYLKKLTDSDLTALDKQVSIHREKLVAIGETGIDGKIAQEFDNMAQQCHFFEFQIELANKHQLPLIIHHRKSHPILVSTLKRINVDKTGVIHGFSGSYQQAKQYLDLGFKLGIGGTISYERANKTINTIKRLPLDCMLLETDAPSMPLSGYQGQANSPLRVIEVFELLVGFRQEEANEIALQLERNVDVLFSDI